MDDSKKPKTPKRPKPDLTTDEAMKYLFPKRLRDGLKEAVNEKDEKPSKP